MFQPAWGSASPGVPGGRHASTYTWTQFSGDWPEAWPAQGFDLQEVVMPQPAWGSAPWPGDAWLSGCNSTGQDKLQKDSPLRKFTHGNRRKPISCGTVPSLSNNRSPMRNHCFSGKDRRGPPKVYQYGLRLLWGTSDFKGQIPVSVCIRHQDKGPTAIAAGPYCLFRWDGPKSYQCLLKQKTGEGDQGPGKGEKERDKKCPDAGHPLGKPYGKPWALKGQGMRLMPNL